MSKLEPYGLISQFLNKTMHYILWLFCLFILIYFIGNNFITHCITNSLKAHIYKDFLFFFDLVLCFFIYLFLLIQFLLKQQKYISYLIDTIHFMKSGNFGHKIQIVGNNEISHLATHIDELRKTVALDKANEKHKLEKEQHLLTSISHDLRTPLTTLIGYLEILLDDDFQNEIKRKQYLEHCLERANQLQYLTGTAFEHFYLSEKENCTIELLRCNSYQNLSQILKSCSQILKQQEYDLHYNLPSCQYALVYDTRMIQRLFDNIFTNIIRYADQEKSVFISGECTKHSLKILIKNSIGCFNSKSKGTGIGLKNCKQIMHIHQGEFFSEILDNDFLVTVVFPIQNKG